MDQVVESLVSLILVTSAFMVSQFNNIDHKCPKEIKEVKMYAHINPPQSITGVNNTDDEKVYCMANCNAYKDEENQLCYYDEKNITEGYYLDKNGSAVKKCSVNCRGCKDSESNCITCNWDLPYLTTTTNNPTIGKCTRTCDNFKDETDYSNPKCYTDDNCLSTQFKFENKKKCYCIF